MYDDKIKCLIETDRERSACWGEEKKRMLINRQLEKEKE